MTRLQPNPPTVLRLDERGRTSLSKITAHRLFTVAVEDDGRLVLDPAVLVPAASLRPDVQAEVTRGENGAASIRPRPRREQP